MVQGDGRGQFYTSQKTGSKDVTPQRWHLLRSMNR